jgi:uncharacterized protein (DUF58 family)
MKESVKQIIKVAEVILLITILFTFAMFQGGFVSWFLFYSLTPILLYIFVLLLYPMKNWKVNSKISSTHIHAGQSIDLTITLRRLLPFPIMYVSLEEVCPVTLNRNDIGKEKYHSIANQTIKEQPRTLRKLLFPYFKREMEAEFQITNLPRGKHTFTHVIIEFGDPFGIVKKRYIHSITQEVVVYPMSYPLKWHVLSNQMEEGTKPAQIYDEKLTNIVGAVREYTPGDKFSWIDWKATARKNTMMTKDFEQEKDAQMAIACMVGEENVVKPLVLEASLELSMSILEEARKRKQHVTFHIHGKEIKHFSEQQIMHHIAEVKGYLSTIAPVTKRREQLSIWKHVPKGAFILTIWTKLDQTVVEHMSMLRKREYHPIVCYIRPSKEITMEEKQILQQLRSLQVPYQVITEKDLLKTRWEVRIHK